ncbi:MAG: cupin domain-containing protein [Methyloligellaceae bacterium]
MAIKVSPDQGRELNLPGRQSTEMLSAHSGAASVTFRRVEISVPRAGDTPREPHYHKDFEECIYVQSGEGAVWIDGEEIPVDAGDSILVPPPRPHYTRNTGTTPLVLLCFFPVADIRPGTFDGHPDKPAPD